VKAFLEGSSIRFESTKGTRGIYLESKCQSFGAAEATRIFGRSGSGSIEAEQSRRRIQSYLEELVYGFHAEITEGNCESATHGFQRSTRSAKNVSYVTNQLLFRLKDKIETGYKRECGMAGFKSKESLPEDNEDMMWSLLSGSTSQRNGLKVLTHDPSQDGLGVMSDCFPAAWLSDFLDQENCDPRHLKQMWAEAYWRDLKELDPSLTKAVAHEFCGVSHSQYYEWLKDRKMAVEITAWLSEKLGSGATHDDIQTFLRDLLPAITQRLLSEHPCPFPVEWQKHLNLKVGTRVSPNTTP
jgi:hypothetical protein